MVTKKTKNAPKMSENGDIIYIDIFYELRSILSSKKLLEDSKNLKFELCLSSTGEILFSGLSPSDYSISDEGSVRVYTLDLVALFRKGITHFFYMSTKNRGINE